MSLFAVIHVGSEQVGMQITEYQSLQDLRVIDRVSRNVALGEETFKTGRISFTALREICEMLKGYRRMLNEYGVRDYRLIATTAVREAENRPYIVDQIQIKTGFRVEVVDLPQEIFYKYVPLYANVTNHGLTGISEGLLFVDIVSGGLGFTLYQNKTIQYQQNIHVGALRIKESFDRKQRESAHFQQALAEYIYSTIEPVGQALRHHNIKYLVMSGLATRLLLRMLGEDQKGDLSFLRLPDFMQLYNQVKALNIPQLTEAYGLSESKAEAVLPTLVLYKQILALTNIEQIVIPHNHFMDGVAMLHIGKKTRDPWIGEIVAQVISFARALGIKYKQDPDHAQSVEAASLLLFDKLVKIHGLSERDRLLLQVAAILHDVGKFINLRRHYFYSYRLIISSDILGFSEEERAVMANIAYYHSKGTPSTNDANFAALSEEKRVTVAKLAAIIRIADAIDRSHRQKALITDIVLKTNEVIISITSEADMSLEEWSFADRAYFFADVFGINVRLIRQVR